MPNNNSLTNLIFLVDGMHLGDQIVAIRDHLDPLLGSVLMLCHISALDKDEKYIGVKFVRRLNCK